MATVNPYGQYYYQGAPYTFVENSHFEGQVQEIVKPEDQQLEEANYEWPEVPVGTLQPGNTAHELGQPDTSSDGEFTNVN